MLSRSLLTVTRCARLRQVQQPLQQYALPLYFRQVRSYADRVVKVPQMAESISEGTLKQWSKQVGDFVEQDEEIATIETDKVSPGSRAQEAVQSASALPLWRACVKKTDRTVFDRLTLPSTRLKQVLSRNSSPTKKTPSLSARISSASSLEAHPPMGPNRRRPSPRRSPRRRTPQHRERR